MATAAQIDANRLNAAASTGPRTAEGKAASSCNATTFGLFSIRNVVRPGDEALYEAFVEAFYADLAPAGAVEHALVAEITSAAWKLRRCDTVEAFLGRDHEPLLDGSVGSVMTAVDRARSLAHRMFHRAIAELRRVQTGREPQQGRAAEAAPAPSEQSPAAQTREAEAESTPPAPTTPRNAPCPCGSNEKYKRCHGKTAPPVLSPTFQQAA